MNSLLIDLILSGVAYVLLIYFIATLTKNLLKRNNNGQDDGEGGIENQRPPKIDLPPGVSWPADDLAEIQSSKKPVEI
jgi:hypothetical protein